MHLADLVGDLGEAMEDEEREQHDGEGPQRRGGQRPAYCFQINDRVRLRENEKRAPV